MIARNALEHLARELISYAVHKLGTHVGVALFVFDFGKNGHLAYTSNVRRDDMIRVVREWLEYQELGLFTDPLGPRGES